MYLHYQLDAQFSKSLGRRLTHESGRASFQALSGRRRISLRPKFTIPTTVSTVAAASVYLGFTVVEGISVVEGF